VDLRLGAQQTGASNRDLNSRRKASHTTHLRNLSGSVTIVRERHPFEGRSMQIMGVVKRRGTLLLLVVLPDGSRSLIPAGWTDWRTTGAVDNPSTSGSERREPCLAPLTDLLHARAIVDALLGRCLILVEPAADEESFDATDLGYSPTSPACPANSGVSRTSPSSGAAVRANSSTPKHAPRLSAFWPA
jgi:hypothetical protein